MSINTNGRTKLTQNDLRRFMNEQKKKLLLNEEKIDSPFAKSRSDGQLMCVLCGSTIKNAKIWKVHINGKVHRENLSKIKDGKIPTGQQPLPISVNIKRSFPSNAESEPPKKIKGILKNAAKPELPKGFFDSSSKHSSTVDIKTNNPLLRLQSYSDDEVDIETETKENGGDLGKTVEETEESKKANADLPEGFFDDPVLDAKARNVEFKDPIQEEWERFRKEIKEENTVSNQIIEVDHEEAIADRQIDEIDEQLRNWSRVLDLEVKKEKVHSETAKPVEEMDQDSGSEDTEFDEFLDWRAKKSFR